MTNIKKHPRGGEIIWLAGAYEVIMALHELHKQGYEQLRLLPGMSPNGCCWRWHIYPKVYMHGSAEMERTGHAPSEEHPYGSCGQKRSDGNIQELVSALKTYFPDVIESGKGKDRAYVKWYASIVEKAEEGHLPIAFADYPLNTDGWDLPGGLSYPPYRKPVVPSSPTPKKAGGALLQTEVAGFDYYTGDQIWNLLSKGKKLRLIREPGNKYDKQAVAVYFSNTKIGYIPRKDNKVIAQLMDEGKGNCLVARIVKTSTDQQQGDKIMFNINKSTQK